MSRFTIGVALGGAAVYFFDPLQGEDRRRRMQSLWRENHETANQVGAGVSRAADSMRPLVRRMKRGLEQRNWADDAATSWGPALTGVLVASAVGGSLVYLLDPQNGPARRKRIVTFVGEKRSGLRQQIRNVQDAAETVRPRINGAVAGVSRMAEVAMARGN
ncbi:MAG TPA: YtxH domain-containing protein [Candidatus Dormibacteraeota bacterium]|nr:YtxH domain-containing protein [Candidatus Dormibacteraeota bacterium]